MRVPGVVKGRLDAMVYLDLVDVHQRLAERRLARACRPVRRELACVGTLLASLEVPR
jgi:hypothetical protein